MNPVNVLQVNPETTDAAGLVGHFYLENPPPPSEHWNHIQATEPDMYVVIGYSNSAPMLGQGELPSLYHP